jgi:hypothetical protein
MEHDIPSANTKGTPLNTKLKKQQEFGSLTICLFWKINQNKLSNALQQLLYFLEYNSDLEINYDKIFKISLFPLSGFLDTVVNDGILDSQSNVASIKFRTSRLERDFKTLNHTFSIRETSSEKASPILFAQFQFQDVYSLQIRC